MADFCNFSIEDSLLQGVCFFEASDQVSTPFAKYRQGNHGIRTFVAMVDLYVAEPSVNRSNMILELFSTLDGKFKQGTKSYNLLHESWDKYMTVEP